ncbi:ferric reductase-like transmembrane domain-containing protein [Actinokineospora guangxiensis]|uniref:Ferric reductase-like transmembrane domain-containing protein n=1 Tax=Actinokineospora guangxiensis TaxID=1490288 RepID=A0ABW0EV05_9PSEU
MAGGSRGAARWAVAAFVVANVVIVEVLFFTAGPGKNPTLTVAKFFGVHAALTAAVQVLLVSRLPWVERRIGMDRLTGWHRWVGFALVWTVLTHAVTVVLGYSALGGESAGATFLSLAAVPASLLGMLAAALFVGVAATSARRVRRRLRYETWHGVHLLLYVALLLALVHQLLETTTFTASVVAAVYWWSLVLFAFGSLIVGRVVIPVRRNRYHQFRVSAVVPESRDAVSVYVVGRHMEELPARAGQFCVWRFPGHRHWWKANPFSLSAAPTGRGLRLTAKAVGEGSAGLRGLKVGERVFVEGPYGAFTSMRRTRPGVLLVAGGVGITPIRSMLEEQPVGDQPVGDVVVLYRVRDQGEAVLLREVRELVAARRGRLHLVTGPRAPGLPSFDPAAVHALVPDVALRDVYVCGPPAMTDTVVATLRTLGVPKSQVHTEKFSLA